MNKGTFRVLRKKILQKFHVFIEKAISRNQKMKNVVYSLSKSNEAKYMRSPKDKPLIFIDPQCMAARKRSEYNIKNVMQY